MIADLDTWTIPEELERLRHFAAVAAVRYGFGESAEDFAQEATLLWLQTPPSQNRLLNLKRKVITRLIMAWKRQVTATTHAEEARRVRLDIIRSNSDFARFLKAKEPSDGE